MYGMIDDGGDDDCYDDDGSQDGDDEIGMIEMILQMTME
jgi:hypothetical protein